MNVDSERTRSLWASTSARIEAHALEKDERADVVVVGAGIAGLSVAYELTKGGKSVVVLDRGVIGGGMTARTSAHLASELDDFYHEFIRLRGEEEARIYYASQAAAINRLEEVQRLENIDCDFARVDGYLFLAPDTEPSLLEKEMEACHRIGFKDVAWADGIPGLQQHVGRCLRFPRQARFHPLKYLRGLVRCLQRDGARLYANSPVVKVEETDEGVSVELSNGGSVHATAAVIATNSPINDWIALHTKQAPYRTYVITVQVPKGAIPDALYWDTADPYHYVRIQASAESAHDYLIVGGEDHKTGEAQDHEQRFQRLEEWTRSHFPNTGPVDHRWSGQVMEPVDYAPYIGLNHGNKRVYISTGDSGEGLTTGVVAGMLLRDLILRGESPWASTYDPQRVTMGAAKDYVSENLTVVSNMAEYLLPGEISSADELRPGQGAILRKDGTKVAAYRAKSGELQMHSAACTHTGCIVHWNALEECWDCPCHGSHFSPDGEVTNGPAIYPLRQVETSN